MKLPYVVKSDFNLKIAELSEKETNK